MKKSVLNFLIGASFLIGVKVQANETAPGHIICGGRYILGTAVKRRVTAPDLAGQSGFLKANHGDGKIILFTVEGELFKYQLNMSLNGNDQGRMFFELFDKAGKTLHAAQTAWIKGEDFVAKVNVNGMTVNGQKLTVVEVGCYQDQ